MTTLVRCGREHFNALGFDMDASIDATLLLLAQSTSNSRIIARNVDHACATVNAVSAKLTDMCTRADWSTTSELCNDQPVDACGYIAADAVCQLREAALAETNGWYTARLPDYSSTDCIHRGNAVLHKSSEERELFIFLRLAISK